MVLYVALWCKVGQYGASFRQSICQRNWATNPYLRQQIHNKYNEKRAIKQQVKEYKVKKNSKLTNKGR
jgi:hypothetical protein